MAVSLSFTHASFYFMAILVVLLGLFAGGSVAQTNHMLSGDTLTAGHNLTNPDFTLAMQPDCNLVLYRNPLEAVWSTGTTAKGEGCELRLKTDGNLVINDKDGKVIWETKSNGTVGHYVLLLQRDRNIVLYSKPIFDSGTGTVLTPVSIIN